MSRIPKLRVYIEKGQSIRGEYAFTEAFTIGREESCDVWIQEQMVSRKHADVVFEQGRWWFKDAHSANGTYIKGEKVDQVPLARDTQLELGMNGAVLSFDVEESDAEMTALEREPAPAASVTHVINKYFDKGGEKDAGLHTMMVRQAFAHVQKKQKKKYTKIIVVFAVLLVVTASYAIYQQLMIQKQRKVAQDIFYRLKEIEVARAQSAATAPEENSDLLKLNLDYEEVLTQLGVYQEDLDVDEKLILRVARIFGECEVDLPKGFVGEVKRYIEKWKSSRRFSQAINRARSNNYTGEIVRRMQEQGLAPQFFYIALQESDFRLNACGPPTRYGYAKGMWQFIPMTAKDYGLKIGPREKDAVADPLDERHDFGKATHAAARYIRRIFKTDAQASGLLVIASYNWGERRVANLIRGMPDNPRDRNFWRLMEDHIDEFPEETYDYVFRIFSAAVIGEDPKHFGFDFDNPLAGVDMTDASQE
ncbi:MAG: FHA domain-containing protein [Candidatus Aminicenantaceae bacterium]